MCTYNKYNRKTETDLHIMTPKRVHNNQPTKQPTKQPTNQPYSFHAYHKPIQKYGGAKDSRQQATDRNHNDVVTILLLSA